MGQALDVVNRYYGVWDKKGEGMEDVIAENFSFAGPLATADRKGFLEAAPQLGQMFQKFDSTKSSRTATRFVASTTSRWPPRPGT